MTSYPEVVGEAETLDALLAGRSIARYGDGEFKIANGGACKSQPKHPVLAKRLREILKDSGKCLVGIPNIRSTTPKAPFWSAFTKRSTTDLLADRQYHSSFITRPDSAPWINTPAYWTKVIDLWRDKDVTLVRGSTKSLTWEALRLAHSVREIVAPRQGAFAEYDGLLKAIGKPDIAILCLGPTATVMAVDLCAKGVHALDLGHIGMFLKRAGMNPIDALEEGRREPG